MHLCGINLKILCGLLENLTSYLDLEVTEISSRCIYDLNFKILRYLVLEFLHSQT